MNTKSLYKNFKKKGKELGDLGPPVGGRLFYFCEKSSPNWAFKLVPYGSNLCLNLIDCFSLVVADFTHDPPETLAVLETPGVDDDSSRAKKKPCLDDRDTNPPLDKDLDTMPGLEEQSK